MTTPRSSTRYSCRADAADAHRRRSTITTSTVDGSTRRSARVGDPRRPQQPLPPRRRGRSARMFWPRRPSSSGQDLARATGARCRGRRCGRRAARARRRPTATPRPAASTPSSDQRRRATRRAERDAAPTRRVACATASRARAGTRLIGRRGRPAHAAVTSWPRHVGLRARPASRSRNAADRARAEREHHVAGPRERAPRPPATSSSARARRATGAARRADHRRGQRLDRDARESALRRPRRCR